MRKKWTTLLDCDLGWVCKRRADLLAYAMGATAAACCRAMSPISWLCSKPLTMYCSSYLIVQYTVLYVQQLSFLINTVTLRSQELGKHPPPSHHHHPASL